MRKWWWRAARTVLWGRAPHTARQAARRSSGRPRPEMRLTPLNVPDSLSRGARPACLTSARALSNRAGSPVSARIAAAPTADRPGMEVTRLVSVRSSRTRTIRASTSSRCTRRRCQSASASPTRSRAPWRCTATPVLSRVASQRARAIRHGALERVGDALADWQRLRVQRDDVEARMVRVLDDLTLTSLVTSIPGLSAVGAAAILAETGDPARFDSARALVKHAGLAPRDNESGTFKGVSRISGRGRPELRLAAWRAVWGALPHNTVLAARHHHLRMRDTNRLTDHQARVAVAGSLLRQLHAVIVHRVPWDARVAAGVKEVKPAA